MLVGDFNFKNINWVLACMETDSSANSPAGRFLNCLRKNNLTQHVLAPTRGRGTQMPSLLDLVITNEEFIESLQHLSPLGKSDHSVLYITCNFTVTVVTTTVKYNYDKGNYIQLCNFIDSKLCPADNYISETNVLEL